ncbi:MAG: ribonuclease HI family protein [Chitinophagaceae bacterium]|nr:ribonuclease HI family protein [Oligoflexus sp.]
MKTEQVKIYFDGGSRGNPGPASGAAYADYDGGRERACFLESATNNEAEYRGLLMGIELARELKLPSVLFLGDSKLVVMQVSGQWKAKHPMMNQLRAEVLEQLKSLPNWQIDWVRRELNAEADRVANQMMDSHQGHTPIPTQREKPAVDAHSIEKSVLPADGSRAPVRADIQKLNGLAAKASFSDFRSLKVGGMDDFSRAALPRLAELIPEFDFLKEAFISRIAVDRNTKDLPEADRTKLLINALRWSARGLEGDLSLRKVLVDLEVTNNIRGKK